MAISFRIRDVFDVSNRGTMLVLGSIPPTLVVAPGDTVVYPVRGGGVRSARVIGVEFLDRRLSSGALDSWLALAVAPLHAATVEAGVEAMLHHRSSTATHRFRYAVLSRPSLGEGQDRVGVWHTDSSFTVALADGAGGVSGSATAAQSLIDAFDVLPEPGVQAADVISTLDRRLVSTNGGQSTAVALTLSAGGIGGASVGDSGAWIIHDDSIEELTGLQNRKPLLGTGACVPVAFSGGGLGGGTLVVASDGLLKYAKRGDIVRAAQEADLEGAAAALVQLVTLRSGKLPDDVSVVLCREVA